MDRAGATSEWTTASDGEPETQRRAQGAVWRGGNCICSVAYGRRSESAVVVSGTCLRRCEAHCLVHLIGDVQVQIGQCSDSESFFCDEQKNLSACFVMGTPKFCACPLSI